MDACSVGNGSPGNFPAGRTPDGAVTQVHGRLPLRIVLLTSGGIHGAIVLTALRSMAEVRVVGMVVSSRVNRPSQSDIAGAWTLIRQCGWRYALYLWTSTRLADVIVGITASASVVAQARCDGIPWLRERRVNNPETRGWLRDREADLILCAFFNQRVAEETCATARFGAVNIHPGPLPAFKGVDPVFHAALRGAAAVGVTLHRVIPDFDSGPVLGSRTLPMPAGRSIMAITADLYRQGAMLLQETLPEITAGTPGLPQADAGVYDSWPSSALVRKLAASGRPLVAARDLLAMLRGSLPGKDR